MLGASRNDIPGAHRPDDRVGVAAVRLRRAFDPELALAGIDFFAVALAHLLRRDPALQKIDEQPARVGQAIRRIQTGVLKMVTQHHQMMDDAQVFQVGQFPEAELVKMGFAGDVVCPDSPAFGAARFHES